MWRFMLSAVLFLGTNLQLIYPQAVPAITGSQENDGFTLYLPFVPVPAQIEAVQTAAGDHIGYPATYYLYGYVRNLTNEPLYNAIVEVEVTIWPYIWPGDPPAPPFTDIVQVRPAMTATLPGQVNPFTYSLTLGKATASIGPILGVSASPWRGERRYAPLTIVGFTTAVTGLTGTVRNDSGYSLDHARVIVTAPVRCGWQEAVLETTSLQPGQEISFSIGNYIPFCAGDELLILGQGEVKP